jgi:diaminopimelate epimerase
METISFFKMNGAGNDFILLDEDINIALGITPELIRTLCNRRRGIGADGVITIKRKEGESFVMQYFNADGSTGSLCGNGARCAIKYSIEAGISDRSEVTFIFNNEIYTGEVDKGGEVTFNMKDPELIAEDLELITGSGSFRSFYVNTGSPHIVIDIGDKNLEEFPVYSLGREIRYLPEFTLGTNVNFIKIEGEKVNIRTYERGVEDETLACGTGSVAAAIYCSMRNELAAPVHMITAGGDELIVNFNFDSATKEFRNITLTGPAEIAYSGQFKLTKFLKLTEI